MRKEMKTNSMELKVVKSKLLGVDVILDYSKFATGLEVHVMSTLNASLPKPGSVHFLEHLVIGKEFFKLANKIKRCSINGYAYNNSLMSINGSINTLYDSSLDYKTPQNEIEEDFSQIDEYFKSVFENYERTITPEELETEKEIIEAEYRSGQTKTADLMYRVYPIISVDILDNEMLEETISVSGGKIDLNTNRNTIGTLEDIRNMSLEHLELLKSKLYHTDNTYIHIVISESANDIFSLLTGDVDEFLTTYLPESINKLKSIIDTKDPNHDSRLDYKYDLKSKIEEVKSQYDKVETINNANIYRNKDNSVLNNGKVLSINVSYDISPLENKESYTGYISNKIITLTLSSIYDNVIRNVTRNVRNKYGKVYSALLMPCNKPSELLVSEYYLTNSRTVGTIMDISLFSEDEHQELIEFINEGLDEEIKKLYDINVINDLVSSQIPNLLNGIGNFSKTVLDNISIAERNSYYKVPDDAFEMKYYIDMLKAMNNNTDLIAKTIKQRNEKIKLTIVEIQGDDENE